MPQIEATEDDVPEHGKRAEWFTRAARAYECCDIAACNFLTGMTVHAERRLHESAEALRKDGISTNGKTT